MKLEQLREETRRILWLIGAGALVLLAITLGQLVVLQRTIIAPVTTLAAAVDRVRTRADYDQHVPAGGDDEVARLGRNFNAMMETIRVRDRDLRQLALFQHALVDSAAYGIISCDPDGTVTSFNRAAERLLGYRADEIVDIRSPNLWHDPKEVAQRARQLSEELGEPIAPGFEVFSARANRGIPDENEWTFIRKDGFRVPVLLSITALKDRTGRLAGFVGLVNDLTERKRAEEEIRKLNRELEQRVVDRTAQLETANQDLEAFAYSVSHDLRSPLRHIDGFLGMIQRRVGKALDEQSLRYMDTISDSIDKMDLLIESLLSFSRLGRKAVSFQEVALETLVRDVIRDLEHETAGRSVDWRIGDLPAVTGDAAILRIVLVNLVSNALKFTRPRPNARIEIGWLPGQDSEVVIFVRDNGVGFDMAYEDKLFGVFQRLHGEEEFEGTGIGLANAQRIIKRHGGRIWAEGKIDRGATFYFSLPQSNPQGSLQR
jgi:signal transduction histidine kinase